jgi:hypothetical protein
MKKKDLLKPRLDECNLQARSARGRSTTTTPCSRLLEAATPSHLPQCHRLRRTRATTKKRDDGECCLPRIFDNNFVAPLVIQYMDIPTLVPFASTSRSHSRLLLAEVARRKNRVRELLDDIRALVRPLRPLSDFEVREAMALQDEARRLIDSGLDWLCSKNHLQDRLNMEGASCGTCRRDRLFFAERIILKPHSLLDLTEHCPMLPVLFYAPTVDASHMGSICDLVSDASVREMQHLVTHLWKGERLSYSRKHADQVLEEATRDRASPGAAASNPYACNLDCPLRIVEARNQRHASRSRYDMEEVHNQLVCRTAKRLVGDGAAIESFRLACRQFVTQYPLSLPFLLWILTEIEQEQTRHERNAQEED